MVVEIVVCMGGTVDAKGRARFAHNAKDKFETVITTFRAPKNGRRFV